MRTLLLLALAACGFEHGSLQGGVTGDGGNPDASGDGMAACDVHDFDGDGLGDSCDKCPHIPSPANSDMDNDGVGDECDERPLSPGDHRALWLAFYDATEIAAWTEPQNSVGAWNISNNLLHETMNGFSVLDSPMTYTTDAYFDVSIQITQPATNEVGFCLADIQPSQQYYCCAASNGGGPSVRAASQYAGSPGQISSPAAFAGNLGPGQHIEMSGVLIGTQFRCAFTQGQVMSTASTAAVGRAGPACFYSTTPVDYRYLFLVTIGS